MNPLAPFDQLITESEACSRYSRLISPRELRKARLSGQIAWTAGKKGVVLYHPDDLAAYLSSKVHGVRRCQAGYGNMADTGSPARTELEPSMHTGTTSELETLVADHLARKYSKRPSKS